MADEDLVQTFKEFDGDGDGHITAAEFRLAMAARHEVVTDEELESIFLHADANKDGKISFAEFTEAWNA